MGRGGIPPLPPLVLLLALALVAPAGTCSMKRKSQTTPATPQPVHTSTVRSTPPSSKAPAEDDLPKWSGDPNWSNKTAPRSTMPTTPVTIMMIATSVMTDATTTTEPTTASATTNKSTTASATPEEAALSAGVTPDHSVNEADAGAWWAWPLAGAGAAFLLTGSLTVVASRCRGWERQGYDTAESPGEPPQPHSAETIKLTPPPPYDRLSEPPPMYEEIALQQYMYSEVEPAGAAGRAAMSDCCGSPAATETTTLDLGQHGPADGMLSSEVATYAEPFMPGSSPTGASNATCTYSPLANQSNDGALSDNSLYGGDVSSEEGIYEEPPVSPDRGKNSTVFVDGVPSEAVPGGSSADESGEFRRNSLYAESPALPSGPQEPTLALRESTSTSAPAAAISSADTPSAPDVSHRNSMYVSGASSSSSEEDLYEPPPVYRGAAAGDEPVYENVAEAMAGPVAVAAGSAAPVVDNASGAEFRPG